MTFLARFINFWKQFLGKKKINKKKTKTKTEKIDKYRVQLYLHNLLQNRVYFQLYFWQYTLQYSYEQYKSHLNCIHMICYYMVWIMTFFMGLKPISRSCAHNYIYFFVYFLGSSSFDLVCARVREPHKCLTTSKYLTKWCIKWILFIIQVRSLCKRWNELE